MRRLLLLLPALAISVPALAASSPVETIELYTYGFKPAPITLAAGHEITLKFVNTSTKGHDFTAPEFFRSSKVIAGTVDKDGKVDLHGSETKSVTLIPAAGTYNARCGRFLHSSFGMHTTVVVR
jgi:plastocyanin